MLTTLSIKVAKMKMRLSIVIITVLVIVLAAGTSAMAAIPVAAGNQTSVITVQTSAASLGNFQDHQSLALEQTNGQNLSPPLAAAQDVGIIGATEDTMAVHGTTTYVKSQTVDTNNKNVAGDNLHTDKIIEFNATPDGSGGRMTSSEDVIVASISTNATDPNCCAFGSSDPASITPASNEVVQAGSTLDVSQVSAHTTNDARVISDTPGTPVALDYSIAAQGINQTPGDMSTAAVGSATAYVDANIQGGNGNSTAPTSTVEYHEVTSVDGLFDLAKSVSYTSAPHN
ncbi:MAG TPA: hypothetical protein VMS89_02235 [Methanoregulaceae archaeon]|nr:hypothetical protein [Methanoregulaceae archaeon]